MSGDDRQNSPSISRQNRPSATPSDKRLLKRVYEEQDNIVDIAKEFGKKDTALRQQLKRARDRVKKIIMKE